MAGLCSTRGGNSPCASKSSSGGLNENTFFSDACVEFIIVLHCVIAFRCSVLIAHSPSRLTLYITRSSCCVWRLQSWQKSENRWRFCKLEKSANLQVSFLYMQCYHYCPKRLTFLDAFNISSRAVAIGINFRGPCRLVNFSHIMSIETLFVVSKLFVAVCCVLSFQRN